MIASPFVVSVGGTLLPGESPPELWNRHQINQIVTKIIVSIWNLFRDVIILYVNPWPSFGFFKTLGSVSVRCYGTTKSFVLKTHGSHDKITILLN